MTVKKILNYLEQGNLSSASEQIATLSKESLAQMIEETRNNPSQKARAVALLNQLGQDPQSEIAKSINRLGGAVSFSLQVGTQNHWLDKTLLPSAANALTNAVHVLQNRKQAKNSDSSNSEKLEELATALEGKDGATLFLRALLLSWNKERLSIPLINAWQDAQSRLIEEGAIENAKKAGRIIQGAHLLNEDVENAKQVTMQLATLSEQGIDKEETTLHWIETALLANQLKDNKTIETAINRALKAASQNDRLLALTRFFQGQLRMLNNDPRTAVSIWSEILKTHKSKRVPAAACRAAWSIARLARAQGDSSAEGSSLRIALSAGVEAKVIPVVEMAALALARRMIEDDEKNVASRICAQLKPADQFQRVIHALQNGNLNELIQ